MALSSQRRRTEKEREPRERERPATFLSLCPSIWSSPVPFPPRPRRGSLPPVRPRRLCGVGGCWKVRERGGDALLSLPLFFVGGCCSAAASRAFVRASDLRPWLAAAAAASDRSRHPPDGATPMECLEERGLDSTVNTLSVRVIFASGLRR